MKYSCIRMEKSKLLKVMLIGKFVVSNICKVFKGKLKKKEIHDVYNTKMTSQLFQKQPPHKRANLLKLAGL